MNLFCRLLVPLIAVSSFASRLYLKPAGVSKSSFSCPNIPAKMEAAATMTSNFNLIISSDWKDYREQTVEMSSVSFYLNPLFGPSQGLKLNNFSQSWKIGEGTHKRINLFYNITGYGVYNNTFLC